MYFDFFIFVFGTFYTIMAYNFVSTKNLSKVFHAKSSFSEIWLVNYIFKWFTFQESVNLYERFLK